MKDTATQKKIRIKSYYRRQSPITPKSLANLTSPKGEIRNPAGRPPKDVSITSIVKVLLQHSAGDIPWPKEKLTWGQALALSWVKRAMIEEGPFITLLDRVEGKVTQQIAINIRAELERVASEMGVTIAEVEAEYQTVIKSLPRGQ